MVFFFLGRLSLPSFTTGFLSIPSPRIRTRSSSWHRLPRPGPWEGSRRCPSRALGRGCSSFFYSNKTKREIDDDADEEKKTQKRENASLLFLVFFSCSTRERDHSRCDGDAATRVGGVEEREERKRKRKKNPLFFAFHLSLSLSERRKNDEKKKNQHSLFPTLTFFLYFDVGLVFFFR